MFITVSAKQRVLTFSIFSLLSLSLFLSTLYYLHFLFLSTFIRVFLLPSQPLNSLFYASIFPYLFSPHCSCQVQFGSSRCSPYTFFHFFSSLPRPVYTCGSRRRKLRKSVYKGIYKARTARAAGPKGLSPTARRRRAIGTFYSTFSKD